VEAMWRWMLNCCLWGALIWVSERNLPESRAENKILLALSLGTLWKFYEPFRGVLSSMSYAPFHAGKGAQLTCICFPIDIIKSSILFASLCSQLIEELSHLNS
jgi:hypothetical protein